MEAINRSISPPSRRFDPHLESIRGLAALAVAGGHCVLAFQNSRLDPLAKLLLVALNGKAAVMLFFGLSGLVLGLAWRREKGDTLRAYVSFCIRRIFRIYPALLASLLLVVLVYSRIAHGHGRSSTGEWFQQFYSVPLTSRLFVENVLLWNFAINAVTWTLAVEIIGSFLLPFFVPRNEQPSRNLKLLLLGALISMTAIQADAPTGVNYLFLFVAGAMIPEVAVPSIVQRHGPIFACGFVVSLALLLTTPLFHQIPLSCQIVVQGAGALLLVGLVWHYPGSPIFKFLSQPWCRFAGRVSYSFYLLHFPIMCLIISQWRLTNDFGPYGKALLLGAISVPPALFLSGLSYSWIEKPAIELGKRLLQGFRPGAMEVAIAPTPNPVPLQISIHKDAG
jgi:peptidoglycan/LPS O-acetylase OafA/YrhL